MYMYKLVCMYICTYKKEERLTLYTLSYCVNDLIYITRENEQPFILCKEAK